MGIQIGDSSRDDLPHSVNIEIFVRLQTTQISCIHGSIRRLLCLLAAYRGCALIPTYSFRITLGDRLFLQDQHCKTSHCRLLIVSLLVPTRWWIGIFALALAFSCSLAPTNTIRGRPALSRWQL